jgi:hypothetical protein
MLAEEKTPMWRQILVAGTSTLAGSLIFGASLVGAQTTMPGMEQTPATMSVDIPNSAPSTFASPQCDPLWYACQAEASPWDYPNSGFNGPNSGMNDSD